MSPSSRRAWIEIFWQKVSVSADVVALLAVGGVSNVHNVVFVIRDVRVALLAEGVDRNYSPEAWRQMQTVALLAEGVDRNGLVGWM